MNAVSKNENEALAQPQRTVLELEVNNHAGVMSHVVGLFSRRAYNVEGILCLPVGDGRYSRIWLLVLEDRRLEQMIKQVEKLEDVRAVRRHGADHAVFERLEEFFR
jgi:acetolactate synthase-1/3 small subunit